MDCRSSCHSTLSGRKTGATPSITKKRSAARSSFAPRSPRSCLRSSSLRPRSTANVIMAYVAMTDIAMARYSYGPRSNRPRPYNTCTCARTHAPALRRACTGTGLYSHGVCSYGADCRYLHGNGLEVILVNYKQYHREVRRRIGCLPSHPYMAVVVCIGMCIGTCMSMCIGMRTGMGAGMCIGMCMGMCMDIVWGCKLV